VVKHNLTTGRIAAAHERYSLYFTMGCSFPLKIALSHRGSRLPSNTWFLGPTRVHNPKGISIGSAVFAGLTIATERQTNRPRCISSNEPHLRRPT